MTALVFFCRCLRKILRIFYQRDWTFYFGYRKICKIDLKSWRGQRLRSN